MIPTSDDRERELVWQKSNGESELGSNGIVVLKDKDFGAQRLGSPARMHEKPHYGDMDNGESLGLVTEPESDSLGLDVH